MVLWFLFGMLKFIFYFVILVIYLSYFVKRVLEVLFFYKYLKKMCVVFVVEVIVVVLFGLIVM